MATSESADQGSAAAPSPKPRRRASRAAVYVEQMAFVLHSTPYRETSLIVELFGEKTGRFAAVAKGAKRPNSGLRAVTQMFQPISIRTSGQHDLHNLSQADWTGGILLPQAQALISAFYLNELLLRLLQRNDPMEHLFEAYYRALETLGLSESNEAIEIALRQFEWTLLQESGYAPDLGKDARGQSIEAHRQYRWEAGQGFVRLRGDIEPVALAVSRPHQGRHLQVSGQSLLDLAQSHFDSERSRSELKQMMRQLIAEQLGGKPLKTRQIFRHLQDFVAES
jgi:DNA repair protein RecO (recombination protein O)